MGNKCIYFVEGSCEKQLVEALKQCPARLIPGKVKVLNPIQKRIPKSLLLTIEPGTAVVFIYDTDKPDSNILLDNLMLIEKHCLKARVVHLMQVLTFEDEVVRSTDVKSAPDLTKSQGVSAFKSDFCRLTPQACRNLLERHRLNVEMLWVFPAPAPYDKIERNRTAVTV